MFTVPMVEAAGQPVRLDDLDSAVVRRMLEFMYAGKAPQLAGADEAIGLLDAAEKYQLAELKVLLFFCHLFWLFLKNN
jgi:hypothetical protein